MWHFGIICSTVLIASLAHGKSSASRSGGLGFYPRFCRGCFSRSSHAAGLSLTVLYHTILHQLCRCEVKDVHGLQSFVSTHSEERDSLLFIFCLQKHMLLKSAFSNENSVISFEECVLVF